MRLLSFLAGLRNLDRTTSELWGVYIAGLAIKGYDGVIDDREALHCNQFRR